MNNVVRFPRVVNREEAEAILRAQRGRFFRATFIKRTTGELRTMVARMGVTKHLTGGQLGFNPHKKGLLPVFDVQKRAYRFVNLDGLVEVKVGGEVLRVVG